MLRTSTSIIIFSSISSSSTLVSMRRTRVPLLTATVQTCRCARDLR
jgi:hypothetical protein